jgi:hypothetical protein
MAREGFTTDISVQEIRLRMLLSLRQPASSSNEQYVWGWLGRVSKQKSLTAGSLGL